MSDRIETPEDRTAARRKAYREANRELLCAKRRAYYATHQELECARNKQYRKVNRELVYAKNKAWNKANKEHVAAKRKTRYAEEGAPERATRRAWSRNNPATNSAKTARYRAAKLNATPAWTELNMIKLMHQIAHRVSKETGVAHHVDHIIPLKSDRVCGLHVHVNLQLLTASANCSKNNHFTTP